MLLNLLKLRGFNIFFLYLIGKYVYISYLLLLWLFNDSDILKIKLKEGNDIS